MIDVAKGAAMIYCICLLGMRGHKDGSLNRLSEVTPEIQDTIRKAAARTSEMYQRLHNGEHPEDMSQGAVRDPSETPTVTTDSVSN